MNTRTQAKAGGEMINGVFYKGGQFLPSDNEPKNGKYNRPSRKSNGNATKLRKLEIDNYKWEIQPTADSYGIYGQIAGTVAKTINGVMTLVNTSPIKAGWISEEKALSFIQAWNEGKRWYRLVDNTYIFS